MRGSTSCLPGLGFALKCRHWSLISTPMSYGAGMGEIGTWVPAGIPLKTHADLFTKVMGRNTR